MEANGADPRGAAIQQALEDLKQKKGSVDQVRKQNRKLAASTRTLGSTSNFAESLNVINPGASTNTTIQGKYRYSSAERFELVPVHYLIE